MAAFLSGSAFLRAFLRADTFLASLSAFLMAALLFGETAFLRAFLRLAILTEMCLGAFLAFLTVLKRAFLALRSLAAIFFFSRG